MSSNSSEVEWEDQAKINEFGRINDRVRALNVQIKALKDLHLNLTDAANELLLSDDDYVSMHVGEAFYSMKKDEAEARLETQKTKIEQDLDRLGADVTSKQSRLAEVKVTLKSKFKDSINLEE